MLHNRHRGDHTGTVHFNVAGEGVPLARHRNLGAAIGVCERVLIATLQHFIHVVRVGDEFGFAVFVCSCGWKHLVPLVWNAPACTRRKPLGSVSVRKFSEQR